MKFSSDFLDQVRDANNVIDVIGQHTQLTKAGASFRGLCPFPDHAEKTPSFYVSDVKQLYHCFGCGKSGTVYRFLQDFRGFSFPEAVEFLAARAHIPLPTPPPLLPGQKPGGYTAGGGDLRKALLKLNRYVAAIYHRTFKAAATDSVVRQYCDKRGITTEMIEEFKIGYSMPGWNDLSNALTRAKAPMINAEKLGLLKRRADGSHFDLFRDRLMFPIMSVTGDVLGFGGRTLSDQEPKYLNSPESEVFSKGRILFGLHATAKHIRSQDEAYVVEGYMDCLALYQFGIKNVVATLGTALTADHAKALKKLCNKVVVVFDGDEAGKRASEKSLPVLLEADLHARCLTLRDEYDPDEFLREHGTEEFLKEAGKAPDHFISFLNGLTAGFKGAPTEKIEILNSVEPVLARVTDRRLRTFYQHEVIDRLSLPPQWQPTITAAKTPQMHENTAKLPVDQGVAKIPKEEALLVQFMLRDPQSFEMIKSADILRHFESAEARALAQQIIEKHCQNPNDFDRLGASLSTQEEGGTAIARMLGLTALGIENDSAGSAQIIQDCMNRVRQKALRNQSKQMLNAIKRNADVGSDELQRFMQIARESKGLRGPDEPQEI